MFFFNTRIFYPNSYSRPHSLDPFLILFVIAFMCTMSMSNHVNSLHLKWIRSLLFSIRLVAFIEILFFDERFIPLLLIMWELFLLYSVRVLVSLSNDKQKLKKKNRKFGNKIWAKLRLFDRCNSKFRRDGCILVSGVCLENRRRSLCWGKIKRLVDYLHFF